MPCLPGGNVAAFQTRSISNLYSTAARPSYSLEKEARGVFAGAGKLIPAMAKPSPAPAAAWYLPGFFGGFQQRGEQLLQDHHLLLQQQLAVQGLLQGSEAESGGPLGLGVSPGLAPCLCAFLAVLTPGTWHPVV